MKQQPHDWFTQKGFIRSLYQLLTLFFVLWFIGWLYNGALNRRYLERIYIPADAQYDIVAFGDSLIEGLGAKQGHGFISIVSDRLKVPIFNQGKRGDNTRTALSRVDSDVIRYHPKLVIISLGGNDLFHKIPLSERLFNLNIIISKIEAIGARVILLGPQTDWYGDAYQTEIAVFAEDEKVTYVPNILDGILFNPKYLFDLVHPNDKGHQLIAERIEPIVQMVLNQIQAEEQLKQNEAK